MFNQPLFVSRGTIIKDLEDVKKFFLQSGTHFNPTKNRGYKLEIKEADRRDMVLKIIRPIMDSTTPPTEITSIFDRLVYEEFDIPKRLKQIEAILKQKNKAIRTCSQYRLYIFAV